MKKRLSKLKKSWGLLVQYLAFAVLLLSLPFICPFLTCAILHPFGPSKYWPTWLKVQDFPQSLELRKAVFRNRLWYLCLAKWRIRKLVLLVLKLHYIPPFLLKRKRFLVTRIAVHGFYPLLFAKPAGKKYLQRGPSLKAPMWALPCAGISHLMYEPASPLTCTSTDWSHQTKWTLQASGKPISHRTDFRRYFRPFPLQPGSISSS